MACYLLLTCSNMVTAISAIHGDSNVDCVRVVLRAVVSLHLFSINVAFNQRDVRETHNIPDGTYWVESTLAEQEVDVAIWMSKPK